MTLALFSCNIEEAISSRFVIKKRVNVRKDYFEAVIINEICDDMSP